MSGGAEDGIEGVAFWASQIFLFEEAVGLKMADNVFNIAVPAHVVTNGWGFDA